MRSPRGSATAGRRHAASRTEVHRMSARRAGRRTHDPAASDRGRRAIVEAAARRLRPGARRLQRRDERAALLAAREESLSDAALRLGAHAPEGVGARLPPLPPEAVAGADAAAGRADEVPAR